MKNRFQGVPLMIKNYFMVRYYLWAIAEKTISMMPYGKKIYHSIGHIVNKNSRGRTDSVVSSFRITRKCKELCPQGGTVLDVGTGWHHQDAFLLYLVGDYKVYLFDIDEKSKIYYIKNYLDHLLNNKELVSRELGIDHTIISEKLITLLEYDRKEEIYEKCNFIPCIIKETTKPFLPENSIDFMLSNCVLPHIPIDILIPELIALRDMLKPDGYMYHNVGHDDNWSFNDPRANQFNYYRYSDRHYKLFFETLQFQNRLVKQEILEIFEKCGLKVIEYFGEITEESKNQIMKLPHIDKRFAKYPIDELAIIYSYVLLQK